ncbi:MAG: copper ion binding protein [Chloroflexota bacterium]|nr:copper ion binding protein [Chloroflexota bacterium]
MTTDTKNQQKPSSGKGSAEITLPVRGMTCASCVRHVERALNKVEGVQSASVNLATGKATVSYDPKAASPPQMVQAIKGARYESELQQATFNVTGMTCASCVRHVERALTKVPGVVGASVNLATEQATVDYAPGDASMLDFKRAVEGAGYGVREAQTYEPNPADGVSYENEMDFGEASRAEARRLRNKSFISLAAGAVLMVLGLRMYVPGLRNVDAGLLNWLSLEFAD